MELPTNFHYFERGDKQTEDLIKEQGFEVCQDIITNDYIRKQLQNYNYGFAHKSPIASIGQKKTKKNNYRLYSYVLYNYEELYNTISIELLCSRKSLGDGKKLLELITAKAIELQCNSITLYSISDEKTVIFYINNGFSILKERTVFTDTNEIKLYHMVKDLRQLGGGGKKPRAR